MWFWEDVSEFNTTNTTLLKNQGYIIFHDSEEKLSDALLMTANKPIRALPEFMYFSLPCVTETSGYPGFGERVYGTIYITTATDDLYDIMINYY